MNDFRQHIQRPGEWEWINTEQQRLGSETAFYAMRNAIWRTLLEIEPGKYFDISKHVKPENVPMFIKIACEFMADPVGKNYIFNKLMNRITHDIAVPLPLKKTEQ